LKVVVDVFEGENNQAVLVSSDGDYASLVNFLKERRKIRILLSPHAENECSILLKRTNTPITYLADVQSLIEIQKEKAPKTD
jgi:hypothetical protein